MGGLTLHSGCDIVALSEGWTHIYMGDEAGVGQVKKVGEGVKLGRGPICIDIGESRLARHA
jgi:hypothetical protein